MTNTTLTQRDLKQWQTYAEIHSQPAIWRAWAPELTRHISTIHEWLREKNHDEVWFCGAGTSAFIGQAVAFYMNSHSPLARFRSVATTDFVAQPGSFLRQQGKLLVVSFGRSGNSSESIGTLDALDVLRPGFDRLHITCNAQGVLATRSAPGPGELRTVILPAQTDDAGFAMTSSYTTMLLTALACFDMQAPQPMSEMLCRLADAGEALLSSFAAQPAGSWTGPERAVFLGSGVLLAVARESALKVVELTSGQVPTLWDSTLGFRHGPKAFFTSRSCAYVLISSDPHTQRYDLDLAQEIRRQYGENTVVTIGSSPDCNFKLPTIGNDGWTAVLYVLRAQYLAMEWSHARGLNVDDPFAGKNLTRVVSGVTLYPLILK